MCTPKGKTILGGNTVSRQVYGIRRRKKTGERKKKVEIERED